MIATLFLIIAEIVYRLKASNFVEHIFNSEFLISVVVKIEVLGFTELTEKMIHLEEFLGAIIASTALAQNLSLVTRNISDFKNIDRLQVIDPHKI